MVFSLFEYLDSVNCYKNAITFDQKEIERKKLYLVGMKVRCASNAAKKNVKIARTKINFFQNIFNKIAIF